MHCDRLQDPPTYVEFLQSYLVPNRPVIIGGRLVSSWSALHDWVVRNDTPEGTSSQINWDHLSSCYGDCEVTVADCATREWSDQKRNVMPFRKVVELWRTGQGSSLYVKDWHLARHVARERKGKDAFYTTPGLFLDDWMNDYYSAHTDDDFRFVYVGATGTFTPLHRDVYTSYSWSTNVCGRKRWWLFPPTQTALLLRKGGEAHLEVAYDVRDVDQDAFPHFAQARPLVVDQEEGETIFVLVQALLPCPRMVVCVC